MKTHVWMLTFVVLLVILAPRSGAQVFTVSDLGTPLGYASSSGISINSSGHVLGSGIDAQGNTHYVVFSNGSAQDLAGSPSDVHSINDSDQVAGGSVFSNLGAALFTTSTVMNLQALSFFIVSADDAAWGVAINNFDQMTGYSNFNNNGSCAWRGIAYSSPCLAVSH